ncbi:transposase [Salmonella enterica subsp. salamae]|nr:transposase [Salmonella enterica subsp. salamae]EDN4181475.1 transposase [Salmonella enterica subsp. salamae]
MTKARFTEEQIADFLHQSKNSISNKELSEKYGFSVTTLRRWQEQHAEGVRRELKEAETIAALVFLGFFVLALMLALAVSRITGAWVILPCLLYCIYYIRHFRQLSAKHIKEEDTHLSRAGRGANNVFYKLCWALIFFFVFTFMYFIAKVS